MSDVSGPDLVQRAVAAIEAGDPTAAERLFREAIEHQSRALQARRGLAKLLAEQLRLEEAEAVIEGAVPLERVPASAHYHIGLCRLMRGDYARGWAGWEQRLEVPDFKHVDLKRPRWRGGEQPAPRLLVISEQGYGDTLQFSRFLPRVAATCGAPVTFLCPTPLLGLYRNWAASAGFAAADSVQPQSFGAYCSIGSLPAILDVRLEDLPGELPALDLDPAKVARFRAERPDARRVIGLCWAGRPTHPQDASRSIAPERLLPLAQTPGVAFVGLQRPPCPPPPAGLLARDWGPEIRDFSDLAAMLSVLDAVVTVDTAIVHLAGTLKRPVELMLAYFPDWRWLLERADSPWYPTVRVHRQKQAGDWTPVVEGLKKRMEDEG
jgi:hypothetical protein